MKITIVFDTDNAAFEDDFAREIRAILIQAKHRIFEQLKGSDKLLDTNGNTVGRVSIDGT